MCGILCILGRTPESPNGAGTAIQRPSPTTNDKPTNFDHSGSASHGSPLRRAVVDGVHDHTWSAVEPPHPFRNRALQLQKKLRHRGPDWSGLYARGPNILCHERLAIVDPESGDQPLFGREDNSIIMGKYLCSEGRTTA